MYEKSIQNARMTFARESNKMPKFYMIKARRKLTKFPNFTLHLFEKYLSRIFGVQVLPPLPFSPSPTPMLHTYNTGNWWTEKNAHWVVEA